MIDLGKVPSLKVDSMDTGTDEDSDHGDISDGLQSSLLQTSNSISDAVLAAVTSKPTMNSEAVC